MGLIDKIISSIADGAPSPIALPDALVFSSIDQNSIARRVKLIERAEIDGRNNYPSSESVQICGTEETIQSMVLDEVRANLQNYDAQQAAYSHRLAMLDPVGLVAKYRGEAQKQKVEVQSKITQEEGKFFLVKQSIQTIEDDWANFKKTWNITHEPKLLGNVLIRWLAIIAIIIFEGIVNGFLIGPYAAGGMAEGAAIAVIFPLITLLIFAWPTGYFIRRTMRPGPVAVRLVWPVFVLVFIAAASILNLLLAYIREAVTISGDWEQAMPLWLGALQLSPSPLSTASFLLLLFSSGLFIFAVFDFFKMDHPIPGLLDKLKNRIQRHDQYAQQLKIAHDQLLRLHRESVSDFSAIFNMLHAWQVEFSNIQQNRFKLWNMLKGYINHVERLMNILLSEYRQVNIKFRSTSEPSYFSKQWEFTNITYQVPPEQIPGEVYSQKMTDAINQIQHIQAELNDVYSEIPKVLQGVNAMLREVRI